MLTQEKQQEVVNRVVAFMAKQQEPSSNGEVCVYLDQAPGRHLQCAIGCMLTDEQCIEADDGEYSVRSITKLGWNDWTEEDSNFLNNLQSCHDEAYTEMTEEDMPFLVAFDTNISEFCERWKLEHPGGL